MEISAWELSREYRKKNGVGVWFNPELPGSLGSLDDFKLGGASSSSSGVGAHGIRVTADGCSRRPGHWYSVGTSLSSVSGNLSPKTFVVTPRLVTSRRFESLSSMTGRQLHRTYVLASKDQAIALWMASCCSAFPRVRSTFCLLAINE